jgi:hypothetical protein
MSSDPAYTASDIQQIGKELSKGGIWANDKVSLEPDWEGEKTDSVAPAKISLSRNPTLKDAREAVKAAGISDETVKAISVIVGNTLMRQMGMEKGETLKSVLEKNRQQSESNVRKWLTDINDALKKEPELASRELAHKQQIMEEKIAQLQEALTTRTIEERELVSMARDIVEQSKGDDAETESRTSTLAKLDARKTELELEVKRLDTLSQLKSSRIPDQPSSSTGKKKKFTSTVY